jgi:hypothetical protein
MFKFNKTIQYDDTTLQKRIFSLENELILLKTHLNALEITNKDLLDKVLRKIQKKHSNEVEETQNINTNFHQFRL